MKNILKAAASIALLAGIALPASAAVLTPSTPVVTLDKTSAQNYEAITASLDFCLPDGAQAGDSFTVGLPEGLTSWPASFNLLSEDGSTVLGSGITSGGTATVTLSDTFDSGQTDVCVTMNLSAQVEGSASTGEHELTFTVAGQAIVVPLDVTALVDPGMPSTPEKGGWLTDYSDQCRTNTTDCLTWQLLIPTIGGASSMTVSDAAQAGQSFDCDTVRTSTDGTNWNSASVGTDGLTTLACTEGSLTMTFTLDGDGYPRVQFKGSVDTPNTSAGNTYSNTADFTYDTGAAYEDFQNVASSSIDGTISGTTSTTEPSVEPSTEPTVEPSQDPTTEPASEPTAEPTQTPTSEPTATPTSEPTATPTTQPITEPTTAPTAKPVAEPTVKTVEKTGELARTGANGAILGVIAGLMLVLGAGAFLLRVILRTRARSAIENALLAVEDLELTHTQARAMAATYDMSYVNGYQAAIARAVETINKEDQ